MLSINNIKKSYNKRVIFGPLNMNIEENKIYFLIGDNGIGKTTLLKCLAGLINFDKNFNSSYDDLFYFIGEEDICLDYLTGRDNMNLISYLKNIDKSNIESLIVENKLEDFIDELCISYSKGMKEKLKLSIGMLVAPQILLLDEPFTSLDIVNIEIYKKNIKNFALKRNHSVIITSHLLDITVEMADKILILKDKNIIEIENNFHNIDELKETIISILSKKEG